MNTNLITLISCIVIGASFTGFMINALRIWLRGSTAVVMANVSENPLDTLSESKLSSNANEYRKTISVDINGTTKSNIPAGEYSFEFFVCKSCGINPRIIDSGAGTLVGLGLLGTFLGLALGITGFDSSNSDKIQSSIQSSLDVMGTAFLTFLLGMFLSLVYTFFEKEWRNGLAKRLYDLNQKLDDTYTLMTLSCSHIINKLSSEITKTISEELNTVCSIRSDSIAHAVSEHRWILSNRIA